MASLNYNKVIIAGRLTGDPELKTTQSGISVTSFTVAVNRPRGKDGESKVDFLDVTAWRQTAEFITRFFRKGSSILVEGTLQKRTWTDQNGQKRSAVDIVADTANFVDSKNDAPAERPAERTYVPEAYTAKPEDVPKYADLEEDDEILPF